MAEAKKTRWVKLGERAAEGGFFDATLKLKVLPGKLVELPNNFRTSKRMVAALSGGHLEYADSEEVKEYLEGPQDVEGEEEDDITEKDLKKMNKAKLTEYILANDEETDEDELSDYDKSGLLELALEIFNKE